VTRIDAAAIADAEIDRRRAAERARQRHHLDACAAQRA
jgi:hypothetical protein